MGLLFFCVLLVFWGGVWCEVGGARAARAQQHSTAHTQHALKAHHHAHLQHDHQVDADAVCLWIDLRAKPKGRRDAAAHPERVRERAVDAGRALAGGEGEVEEGKGAELRDVGREEDEDELPPYR